MTSLLTELGARIYAFSSVDEALDELSTVHGDPDAIPLPTLAAESPSDRPLGVDQVTPTSLGRVLPLRPLSPVERASDAAENFDPPEAA